MLKLLSQNTEALTTATPARERPTIIAPQYGDRYSRDVSLMRNGIVKSVRVRANMTVRQFMKAHKIKVKKFDVCLPIMLRDRRNGNQFEQNVTRHSLDHSALELFKDSEVISLV